MHVGETVGLVHVERDLCGRGTGLDQHACRIEGLAVGVLVLEASRVGHDGAEEVLSDRGREHARGVQAELGDDDARRGGVGAHHAGVPEGLARGMVVEDGDVAGPVADLLGICQPGLLGEVHADEEVGRHVVVGGVDEGVRAREEAVDPRHGALVGQEVGHALAGPCRADDLGEREAGPDGVAIGRGVRADRDGVRILDQRDDALEELGLLHVLGNPHQALPYSPSASSPAGATSMAVSSAVSSPFPSASAAMG